MHHSETRGDARRRVIYDLPFLEERAKRNILGANAARLFGLDTKPVKKRP